MKRLRLVALTALLLSIQVLSMGCRKLHGPEWVFYANEKDHNQIVALEAGPQPLRQWWHGAPRDVKSEGQYIRNDGKEATAGSYWSEANVYVLKLQETGATKEVRFSIQPDLSLRDANGAVWRRAASPPELHLLVGRR